jgi:hypothetical protein
MQVTGPTLCFIHPQTFGVRQVNYNAIFMPFLCIQFGQPNMEPKSRPEVNKSTNDNNNFSCLVSGLI